MIGTIAAVVIGYILTENVAQETVEYINHLDTQKQGENNNDKKENK